MKKGVLGICLGTPFIPYGMKCELIVGKKEYIAAGKLMSADKTGRNTRRMLFAVLVFVCLLAALYLLSTNGDPIAVSVLFGVAALFVWLFVRTKSKWDSRWYTESAEMIKPMKAMYGFFEDGFVSSAAGKEIRFSWTNLERWGYFEEFLYLEFSGKQIVTMERAQLSTATLSSVEELLCKIKEKTDFE